MAKIRIIVVYHRLGPYHQARLNAAGQLAEIHAVELCAVDHTYAWQQIESTYNFERITLFHDIDSDVSPKGELVRRMNSALNRLKPDAVAVPGWSDRGAVAAILWSVIKGVPVVMMSDSSATDQPRTWWKETVKRRIIGNCGGALVAGTLHRDYMSALGLPVERIFTGYDVVDNNFFCVGAKRIREDAAMYRQNLGLPDNFFLASARFLRSDAGIVRVKNLHRLIDAYARYLTKVGGHGWGLVILGDGELRAELEAQIDVLKLRGQVILPGFRQYPDLPTFYGLASAFILASLKDTWGLVVNEAMASGLPVLVSERCGCADDLIDEGVNGYTFDPCDIEALANLMMKISSDECDRAAMGRASQMIISRWTPETFAKHLLNAVQSAAAVPHHNAGFVDRALLWALAYR